MEITITKTQTEAILEIENLRQSRNYRLKHHPQNTGLRRVSGREDKKEETNTLLKTMLNLKSF